MSSFSKLPANNNLLTPSKISRNAVTSRNKKRILCWSDSVTASTGFSTVAKHILWALHKTGQYEIDQLGINYFEEFYDKKKYPYNIIPARLNNPKDPYGNQMFLNSLQKGDYDIVFIINDTFVVEQVAQRIEEVKNTKRAAGRKVFQLVYYYPVDCRFLDTAATMVRVADRSVAYTNFAKTETERIEGLSPTDVIYHGADLKNFYPLKEEEIKRYRAEYLHVKDDNHFVWINVNRNSIRKDIARTVLAFSEFKKKVPNSTLYLHMALKDSTGGHTIDLSVPIKELGLQLGKDVIFPAKFNPGKGWPIEVLNRLYNCGNAYISTNLGEGFGLSALDAMVVGLPVVIGNNTSAPEIFGNNRGYLYKCKEKILVDNSGLRAWGRLDDILEQMFKCHNDWKNRNKNSNRKNIIKQARNFVQKYSWDNVCKDWVKLFSELKPETGGSGQIEGESI